MERLLEGKNVVITGSNKGIGKAILRKCAESGANIWACMRTQDDVLTDELKHIESFNDVWITPVFFDLGTEEAIASATKQILSEKKRIDVIINNAGITGPNQLFMMTPMKNIKEVVIIGLIIDFIGIILSCFAFDLGFMKI